MPILATKLYVPPRRSRIVLRPRLDARLTEGLQRRLTLISAPAGFGKSTLVAEWVAECGLPVAWLSLDEGDAEPTRFLTYVVEALRTVRSGVGEGALAALGSPQPPSVEATLTPLVNELAALPTDVVLVLDDYHSVDARAVDEAVAFLLEHLPSRVHVTIATREDPALPLARWRARAELTEIRAADLRFTLDESAAFLNQIMDLGLSTRDVDALETTTEAGSPASSSRPSPCRDTRTLPVSSGRSRAATASFSTTSSRRSWGVNRPLSASSSSARRSSIGCADLCAMP